MSVFDQAAKSFILEHCGGESTARAASALKAVDAEQSPDRMFEAAVRCGALDFADSLRWAFFLQSMCARLGDAKVPEVDAPPTFSTEAAFDLIREVFDVASEDCVWSHLDAGDPE